MRVIKWDVFGDQSVVEYYVKDLNIDFIFYKGSVLLVCFQGLVVWVWVDVYIDGISYGDVVVLIDLEIGKWFIEYQGIVVGDIVVLLDVKWVFELNLEFEEDEDE